MKQEQEHVLKMLEMGKISAEEADDLLDVLDEPQSETMPPPLPEPPTGPNMDVYRENWRSPFNAALVTLGVSSGAFLGLRSRRGIVPGTLRLLALPIMLISAVVAVVSYWSKDAPWVHVRVREQGEQKMAVSVPIPVKQVRRSIDMAREHVDDPEVAGHLSTAAEFLEAFDVRGERDPLSVDVAEDDTQVDVFLG